MPIYEYECQACHHQFDLIQKMGDEPVCECPSCHQQSAQRLISAAGFRLSGTGWYATDFRDQGKNKTTPKENTESTPPPSDKATPATSVESPATSTTKGESN